MADGMRSGDDAAARLAALLGPWWHRLGGEPPACAIVPADALPAAVRPLLDHTGSMTLRLEAHWGGPLGVRRLADAEDGDTLTRASVLHTLGGDGDGTPVELAVIRMALPALPVALHDALRAAAVPFGRLLADHGIAFAAEPLAFFRLEADAVAAGHGAVDLGTPLYGRLNRIVTPEGATLCDVVEIVPRA
ncbi:chorismate--pyruvate lyase family protein [Azospirillum sp.]|uniref:chorismate--pyruvate lyase family protein n=1 Tax=Azospirillum sp. TaxID=34012 RepID=UPI003D728BDE